MSLDLNTVERDLHQTWPAEVGQRVLYDNAMALLGALREAREALLPFAIAVGPQEGNLYLMRTKDGRTWFQVAQLGWNDLERARAVLGYTP